jgi:D-alanyl-D-alanine carboxypeptidase
MRNVAAFATLALLLSLAIVSPSPSVAAEPAVTAPTSTPPAAPIPAIDRIAREEIDQKKVASYAVAVVKDGRIVLARGYGFANLENDVPATAETIYRLGSITKQFTAMAIMLLAEDGKLSVDDELTKFLPDYPTGDRKITIRQLLNHTAGLKDYTRTKDFDKFARHDHTHAEMLALFQNEPPEFKPGTRWAYSNANYYLLGMIIERASGQSYEDFLDERIFRPLNMSATRYGHPQQLIPRRASGYKYFFGQLTNDDGISMDPPYAAGALVSNLIDMIKWHQALEAGALVSSASYEEMYRPAKLANGISRPYGFGWRVATFEGHNTIGHGGGINGFSTMISRYPDDRLAVIVLSNTAGADPGAVADRIARVMLSIAEKPDRKRPEDEPTKAKPQESKDDPSDEQPSADSKSSEGTSSPEANRPIDAALAAQLVGKYRLMDEQVEVITKDGQLFARLKGRLPDHLQHQGDRDFVHAADPELRITFTPSEGPATELEVQAPRYKFGGKRVE